MLPLLFTQNAQNDIIKHVTYYEEKLPGLGLRLVSEIQQAANEISTMPTGYASYLKNTRERATNPSP